MRALAVLFVAAAVLAIVPGWSGEAPLVPLGTRPTLEARPVALDATDPARTRTGRLTYLGGVHLTSRDRAFGGYSAVSVVGDRFTLLGDGGSIIRFRMGADWRPDDVAFANLPSGPRTGWEKRDRDSESLAIDPRTGQAWIGFEEAQAIWRFAPGFARAEAQASPPAMAKWNENGGPESLVRLADGRFVAISETSHVPPRAWRGPASERLRTRDALIFSGDPALRRTRARRFAYLPAARYDPADAAVLPNGDLLMLDRDFAPPFHWSNRLSIVPAAQLRAGGVARGRLIAVLDTPLVHDNFEGIAATREGRHTIVWLVSDDNQTWPQRTLLLKFRLER